MNINKIKTQIASLIALVLISGCSSTPQPNSMFYGENLVTPYSGEIATWKVFKRKVGNFNSRMWQKPGKGLADSYAVSITYHDTSSTSEIRDKVDKPGRDQCESFESQTLTFPKPSAYPLEYWETLCTNGNSFKAKILHLMIEGNDSFYHVQKTWKGDFSAQQVSDWKAKFESIYVCDNRSNVSPCPEVSSVDVVDVKQ